MDRITRVRIKNVRAIEYVDLEISRPLTVLIGENGAGKSTIIECLEILRKAAEPRFIDAFYAIHRGLPGLLRKGAPGLELGVVVEDDAGQEPRIEYTFALVSQGASAAVQSERLQTGELSRSVKPTTTLRRSGSRGEVLDERLGVLGPIAPNRVKLDELLISGFGAAPPHQAIKRLLAVLRGIEVQLHFDTTASWAGRSYQRPESVRGSTILYPAERLSLLGFNLANAWAELRGREATHWEHTMDIVRMGLGNHVDSIVVPPDMGGGNVYLGLRIRGLPDPILAANLSDGQLAWLAFVAMTRLNGGRSILAVDEPELHLHPNLLGGVVELLKGVGAPVIVATHADRVLEMLDKPADAVRVCSLDDTGRAVVAGIDSEELEKWLAHYGDFGRLRAAGYLSRVVRQAPDAPAEEQAT